MKTEEQINQNYKKTMHQLPNGFTVANASMNDSYRKNVAMQTTVTSRKETETAKKSPEEKNEVPIF